ncbi:expressed unknown protein [Seminavis robusta]|uniref:Uncharacterized protein n=1 Tax=Seminavis robusta TaxID=568900 RepID=A0A9N8EY17_9STRA|nr:expressed unknown protein [Seminavis robusta]|eukprot:Sro2794_g337270.1 n/a (186) ;mRNA; r:2473-3030
MAPPVLRPSSLRRHVPVDVIECQSQTRFTTNPSALKGDADSLSGGELGSPFFLIQPAELATSTPRRRISSNRNTRALIMPRPKPLRAIPRLGEDGLLKISCDLRNPENPAPLMPEPAPEAGSMTPQQEPRRRYRLKKRVIPDEEIDCREHGCGYIPLANHGMRWHGCLAFPIPAMLKMPDLPVEF